MWAAPMWSLLTFVVREALRVDFEISTCTMISCKMKVTGAKKIDGSRFS